MSGSGLDRFKLQPNFNLKGNNFQNNKIQQFFGWQQSAELPFNYFEHKNSLGRPQHVTGQF